MNEQDDDESLDSQRDSSSFWLEIMMASSKVEAREILLRFDVPEEEFANRFPSLAKLVQGLPDESDPPA
ncbi:hypothetical protein ABZ646_25330 [Streptomyces sp. NPDC007162]|uniref:hypothetical protein n=1 Tax=Streptomyces sp. NPDC007162 TaxID=3156917 RepID=UPI0033D3320A